ncbi:hypothetical protein QL285_062138 [Trifolium repens]|nr:hypothetical protein QL285_062138 [Trifolium repens]
MVAPVTTNHQHPLGRAVSHEKQNQKSMETEEQRRRNSHATITRPTASPHHQHRDDELPTTTSPPLHFSPPWLKTTDTGGGRPDSGKTPNHHHVSLAKNSKNPTASTRPEPENTTRFGPGEKQKHQKE